MKANPESKMFLFFFGDSPNLLIHDHDMAEKLLDMVPYKIDRNDPEFIKSAFFWMKKSLHMAPTS